MEMKSSSERRLLLLLLLVVFVFDVEVFGVAVGIVSWRLKIEWHISTKLTLASP